MKKLIDRGRRISALAILPALFGCFISLTSSAEDCYGSLTNRPLTKTNGMSETTVVCTPAGTNPCTVMSATCRSDIQFDPEPPEEETVCQTNTLEDPTGARCVPHIVHASVTYFVGRGYCNSAGGGCESGCTDWDTERSSPGADLPEFSWAEDTTESCPGG